MRRTDVFGTLVCCLAGCAITALSITLTVYLYKAQNIIMNLKEDELLLTVNLTCLVFFNLVSAALASGMISLGGFLLKRLIEMSYEDAVGHAKKEMNGHIPIKENNENEDI
jgi:hypothetical protein